MAAATELFATEGFAAVGIDDIGAAVGVSGPAIYRHFRGKDAVLAGVLLEAVRGLADAVDAGVEQIGYAPAAALVQGVVAAALDRPAALSVYLRERHRLPVDAAIAVAEQERRIEAAWGRAFDKVAPELGPVDRLLRQAAVSGMLATATTQHPGVARPRLDELLAASAAAMILAPSPRPGRADRSSPATAPAWTPPTGKRDEILTVALRLFAERGYRGVGIDEVGEAAGISGPTVYHYVASKAELLVDAYDRVGQRVAVGVERSLAEATSPADALDRLVASYVGIAMDSVDLIVVTSREGSAIPADERPRLSRRRRAVRDGWVGALSALHPDLEDSAVRLLVRSAFPLVNEACRAARGDASAAPAVAALAAEHLRSADVNDRLTA